MGSDTPFTSFASTTQSRKSSSSNFRFSGLSPIFISVSAIGSRTIDGIFVAL